MQYIVRTVKGKIISTNISELLISNIPEIIPGKLNKRLCIIRNKGLKESLLKNGNYELYLCTDNENITNKIFLHKMEAAIFFLKTYSDTFESALKRERSKTTNLKHNLITLSAKIHQELFKIISQSKLSDSKQNQVEIIKQIIQKEPDKVANSILRIFKNSNLLKAEFDVHEMLNSINPHLDYQQHSIHKVINLSLSSFWLDFLGKKITVNIENCLKEISFDYKSMSSILCHIFDNATKYCTTDSELKISFKEEGKKFLIIFEMLSLKVWEKEISRIFEEGYSSDYSEKLGFAGSGIGMNVIKRLAELNKFKVNFKSNVDPLRSVHKLGIPFDINQLILEIPISE